MAAIHRLLCTHCTFGTSELESSSGDNAGKVLGYSVRKSSLPDAERGQLRQVFRAVERLLSYGLPKDATAAHKETLAADTAPRRLIFFPNLGGWQVAGQVSYRTFDTSQPPRPGSYFADLIVAKAPDPRNRDSEPAWSPCDVLQLWGVGPDRKTRDQAGWWISSEGELAAAESEGPWKPIAPPSVAAVREPRLPLIDDDAAHRFLAADAVAADPLVPARWWAMPAERRRELVAHMLQATIQGPARGGRETVTIAAEPSVAAVLFYIVCRLLPRRIAAGMSFSTYEPAPERPLTGLVATTFLNEEAPTADLPPELAQRGFACNTFRDVSAFGRCQPPPEQGYARRLIALAAANDWVGIDSLLAALDAEGLKAADLDQLIKIDHLVTAYFGGEKPTGLSARRGPQEARFLRERFRGVLETQAATRAEWPSDLVEAAIVCLEGDLENLWTAGGPVRALLERYLPDGDGLKRLLKPSQGTPAAPRALVVAAVVSATLRGKPPHLPSSFIQHCREAREGRNRAEAVDLLRDVIRVLPEDRQASLLVGVDSTSFTDLLLDVTRSLGQHERDGLKRTLTELLSNTVRKLTAKNPDDAAELLARHADVAASISASHPGLQTHLEELFQALLDDNAREPGRHLMDSVGRSRVAGLQQWAAHARDGDRVGQLLTHWKSLHDAVTALAADAPAWRSWAKPAAPEGREIPAAIAAIEGLRPFDVAHRIKARERQQSLAKIVVQTFKQAQPEGSDLRAGWETVGHWVDRALAEEAERRAPGRVQGASSRSAVATYGLFGGTAALIAVALGLAAYSQGALDELLPDAWRWQGEREVAAAPTDPAKRDAAGLDKPKTGANSKPNDTPGTAAATGAAGGPVTPTAVPKPAAPPPPKPDPVPPLTAADANLKLALDKGELVVTWNHEKLKPRISDSPTLSWKGPNSDHREQKPTKDGQATIDTRDGGFGKYEVKLSVKPSTGNGNPFDETKSVDIVTPPQMQLSDPAIDIRGGKPFLRVKVTPVADDRLYGAVSYQLNGPDSVVATAKADGDGTVVFELPDMVTPATYQAQLPQFTVATVVPQGAVPAVNLPPVHATDPSQAARAMLDKQHYITALAAAPGKEPQPLCDLPWTVRPEQFDVWLMTPEFKPGMSLTLGPKDPDKTDPRWRCNATVTEDTGGQAMTVLVGDFEFDASSPWQPRLRFKAAEHKETGHQDAYAALRCCRLCLVIARQPVATSQLVGPSSLGPLKIKLPVPFKPISAAIPALEKAPNSLAELLLAQSKPEPIKPKETDLVLSLESGRAAKFQLEHSKSANATAAVVVLDDDMLSIKKFDPPLKSNPTTQQENQVNDENKKAENARNARDNFKEKNGREPTSTETEALKANIVKHEEAIKSAKEILEKARQWNEFAESVRLAEFTVADWQIAWETNVARDKSPLPSEVPGGTAVIFIQGSPAGEPIFFKVPEKPAPNGKQTADASESPAE